MNRQEWLLARRQGVGGSDAPAICGISPYTTAYQVQLDKWGELPLESEPNAHLEWGSRLEPMIIQAFSDKFNVNVVHRDFLILRHPKIEWMACSPDGIVHNGDERSLLQVKNSVKTDGWGTPGTNEIPEHVMVQVQHELAVTGFAEAHVAVLIQGFDFRVYHVQRNDAVIQDIAGIEAEFWDKVQKREPIQPDWEHSSTPELVAKLNDPIQGERTHLGINAALHVARFQQLGEQLAALERERDVERGKLILAMGRASFGDLPDGTMLVRKAVTRKSYTVPESTYYQFRVKPGKKGG